MTKQAKRDKAAKKADKTAAKIVEEAYGNVATKATEGDKYASERLPAATDADYEMGCAVRSRRDEGEAWWAIAEALNLPGAGSSATTGKKGAGKARALYAKAFGKHPASFVRGVRKDGSHNETNEHVKAVQQERKVERKAKVRAGGSVLDLTLTDEELVEMVRGRKISWGYDSELSGMWHEDEARVHPTASTTTITGEGSTRTLNFQEQQTRVPREYRLMAAHSRSVRLAHIYSVKG